MHPARTGRPGALTWGALAVLTGLLLVDDAAVRADAELIPPDRTPAVALSEASGRPNVVLIMTDDQNRDELRWMPKTRALLGRRGYTFSRALSPAPLCCPARAMTVTGQYGHNNGVQSNGGPFGGFQALQAKGNTLAAWLEDAGYQTALVGKYLNGYQVPVTPRQEGWTRWNPAVRNIYDYRGTGFLNDAGRRVRPRGHVTTYISARTTALVREFSAVDRPFFIWASHIAPHGRYGGLNKDGDPVWKPPRATTKHRDVLGHVRLPARRKPSFNATGKGPDPYPRPRLSAHRLAQAQAEFTGRIRTLQDVDDAVERLIEVLRETNELGNTYVVFVSDNGMLMGEHRLMIKNVLYRDDMEIPLLVRVPGMSSRRVSRLPATIGDLAPTILDLAGAEAGRTMDGRSFAPVLHGREVSWRNTQLIQTGSSRRQGPQPGWEFRGVTTRRFTYMRRADDGAQFLFDRQHDPYELVNVAPLRRYRSVLQELRRRHDVLIDCSGDSCNRRFPPLPGPGG